ncbi:Peptidoglycan-binding protein [Rhodovastum atsumiense]|uniref:Peptidoglycan-binding protein n=1 Tax=Rhodovastum atsumiense TaxID=504468 RepID=A0A5M6IYX7_9PROT|nr:peptidoglycan-binding protein [Rhodovastum atsumiense]KAA5613491.1 peptidoglycan-binding protein [Rhodovastum atsumiense]CAH2603235.1 Peptidoglycan-binding protein [Rhodovastum atsumiense]
MDLSFAALRPEYLARWQTLQPRVGVAAVAADLATGLAAGRARYDAIGGGVPWWWIAAIHQMESSADFGRHLHNGDPLGARTVHVPCGRPPDGQPPFTWESSARDALVLAGVWGLDDWSAAPALWRAERFNGMGYRLRGVASPYLWAGSTHYSAGQFIADGRFSAGAVCRRPGVALLWAAMAAAGLADIAA